MSEEVICKQKDTSEYFEESMNTTMSVEYAEDAISLSGENTPRQKWLSNDVNKEELLVNIKCLKFYDKRSEYIEVIKAK